MIINGASWMSVGKEFSVPQPMVVVDLEGDYYAGATMGVGMPSVLCLEVVEPDQAWGCAKIEADTWARELAESAESCGGFDAVGGAA